MPTGGR